MILVLAFGLAASAMMGAAATAQSLSASASPDMADRHCDDCGDASLAAMACGVACGPLIAVIGQGPAMMAALPATNWSWANNIAASATVEPEQAPPRT